MFSWVAVRHLLHKTTAAAHVAEAIRSGSSVQWAVVWMNKHLTFLSQVFPPPGVLQALQRSKVCPCVKVESETGAWGWHWSLQTVPPPQSYCLPCLLGKTTMDMHISRWFWLQKPVLKGCHADSFCLRGNIPCGASQSQISTELLPMHPHTHTGLQTRIFLLQTNFNVSSIVTNTQTSIPYCLPTVYLHVLHGRRKVWSWYNSYNKSISGKNPKSNALLLLWHELQLYGGGKLCSFSDIWGKVLENL